MNQPPTPGHSGVPHNPAVREIIDSKRRWSSPPNQNDAKRGFRGWHERAYLPHRDEPGLTQFVTFRLADSFPESLRSEWEHLLQIEDDHERRSEWDAYLDRGRGESHLQRPEIAILVENALRFFDGERYRLSAWVVMSNHVHVLFKIDSVPMAEIIQSWKKYTANKANRVLNRCGSFWAADYFDTYMRNAEQERQTIRYIENNPIKARLTSVAREWPWSSARFRDAYGRLRF